MQTELKQEKEFKTLKQKKRFKARLEYTQKRDLVVCVTPKLGVPRGQIPSNEFKGIWDTAKKYSHETRYVNKNRRLESYSKQTGGIGNSFQVSYITALIDHIVKDQNME